MFTAIRLVAFGALSGSGCSSNSAGMSPSGPDGGDTGGPTGGPNGAAVALSYDSATVCAVTAAGDVWCWGENSYGKLGPTVTGVSCGGLEGSDGLCSSVPVKIPGLSGATAVSANLTSVCAIEGGGGVKCWGGDGAGQLGDNHGPRTTCGGGTSCATTPVQVAGLTSGVTAISSSQNSVCAVASGGMQCWGDDTYGQLGNGAPNLSGVFSPAPVTGLASGVTGTSLLVFSSCGIAGGAVQCWGRGVQPEAHGGPPPTCYQDTTCSPVPEPQAGLASGVTAMVGGTQGGCAIVSGGAQCWGSNQYGELGNGTTTSSLTPVPVSGLGSGVSAVAYGGVSCAIAGGALKCWGAPITSTLFPTTQTCGSGSNAYPCSTTPVAVPGLDHDVTAVASDGSGGCAIASGRVFCWGDNHLGQLGNGSTATNSPVPVEVSGL